MTNDLLYPMHVTMVVATFYDDIAEMLLEGARRRLDKEDCEYEPVRVPGALEIPPAIRMLAGALGQSPNLPKIADVKDARFPDQDDYRRWRGYLALGCVIRGETSHYDIVANESARGLMDLGLKGVAIGNGILTVDSRDQAIARADPNKGDKGGHAAEACLSLIRLADLYHHDWTQP